MSPLWFAAIMAVLALSPQSAYAQDGKVVFNNACRTCHSLKEGDNRLGPNLHAIVGRKAGSTEGYGYSSALQNLGASWDEATLDRFIANPDEVAPGHNMKPYPGMPEAEDRKKIIEFLKTQNQ